MMRHLFLSGLVAGLSLSVAGRPAYAGAALCIYGYDIDHTAVPNDSTILFYMRGGQVYKNVLTQSCPGLSTASNGFTYAPTDPGNDEICSNLDTIRVNEDYGGRLDFHDGPVCLLGQFTKVEAH